MNINEDQLVSEVLTNNQVLYDKISGSLHCSPQEVPDALREVIRFLFLTTKNTDGLLTPSVRVDQAWHEFILCTRAYWEFCQQNFGHMIHHYPGGLSVTNKAQFSRTLELYNEYFQTPPPRYWGVQQSCGGCESQ
jgi:hypothetical protein